jgi:hypothetical protein
MRYFPQHCHRCFLAIEDLVHRHLRETVQFQETVELVRSCFLEKEVVSQFEQNPIFVKKVEF